MNKLELRTTAQLISLLANRIPLSKVIVDSPTKSTQKYAQELRQALDNLPTSTKTKKIEIVAENKADLHYPIVGAASILAKVTRDHAIASLEKEYGAIGSGYPADPATSAYLAKHWREGHDFFRKSWESYRRLANNQSSLGSFDGTSSQKETSNETTKIIAQFEVLREHGYMFVAPTNQYEVVRMQHDGVTIIYYTTGKLVVQGNVVAKKNAENLLKKLNIPLQK